MRKYIDIVNEGFANGTINNLDVEDFIRGYVEAMLATSSDESTPDGGEPLNRHYDVQDFSSDAMDRIKADCRAFLHSAGPFITEDRFKGARVGTLEAQAGHDFWLTRCGHGAGFWDGDWEGEDGQFDGPITSRAKAFGNIDPYVGDDGDIHLM